MVQIAVKAVTSTAARPTKLRRIATSSAFRHLQLFFAMRDANRAATIMATTELRHVAGIRPENGRQQRDRHPGNTEVIPGGTFHALKARYTENNRIAATMYAAVTNPSAHVLNSLSFRWNIFSIR